MTLFNEEQWLAGFKELGALWKHDGNPKRPHALLTSGKHSDGFVNCELVLESPQLLRQAAVILANRLNTRGMRAHGIIDRVVGPAMGAITFAHELAFEISQLQHRKNCLRGYTEKSEQGGKSVMVFGRTKVKKGEYILCCEDVFTTGGSVAQTIKAVVDAGAIALPWIPVLVNRSDATMLGDKVIIALVTVPMQTWASQEDCLLCQAGSEAIRPKGGENGENWARLTADY